MPDPITPTPGQRIREELDARGWTQADLAAIIDRPLPTVNEIIAGKKAITAETALQLALAFDTTPEVWMQLETAYRLSRVETRQEEEVSRRARLYSMAPIKDMEKRQWISRTSNVEELEVELLRFFEVDSLDKEPEIGAVARKSSTDEVLNSAQRGWCFRAKKMATLLQVKPFDPSRFEKGVARLRELAAYPEETRKVSRVLGDMGIRFVVLEPLPKTRIDGAAFWLDQHAPVIALSLRYDRIDNFWHALGHELSHIRHRDVALVDSDMVGENRLSPAEKSPVELRADREAAATWIDQKELDDFIVRVGPLYSKARINQFANRIRIHPGIIVGQLQERGEIGFSRNRDMLIKIRNTVTAEALTDGWGHTVGGPL